MSQIPPTSPTDAIDASPVPVVTVGSAEQNPAVDRPPLDVQSQPLIRNFASAVENSATADLLFKSIFEIVDAETDCLAMWRVEVDASEPTMRASSISDDNAITLWQSVEDQIAEVVGRAKEFDQICSCFVLPDQKHVLVAAPLDSKDSKTESREILAACFAAHDQTALRLQWLMGIASQSVSRWQQRRQTEIAQTQSQTLTDAIGLFDAIVDSNTSTEAAIAIVNNLRRLFKANQVAMAEVNAKGKPTLLAVSDVAKIDHGAANNKLLFSAIAQSVAARSTITYPHQDAAVNGSQEAAHVLPLKNWCNAAGASSAISLPMVLKDGEIVGALLVTLGQAATAAQQQSYVETMTGLIAKQFDVANRANRSTLQRLRSKLKKRKSTTGKIVAGLLLCAGLMAVPMPYRVTCECELQPTQRRFVAAPYNGILEKSLVEVGEQVSKDQVIARLEGRQLRIELAGVQAEYEGARRRRDSSLAMREIAQSQIAKSEMNRLAAQTKMLNNRIKDLEVRSPIDGVIVSGDMDKVQGAPLEMGQNLFEVAPLETMVAEIGIPESEIHYVKDTDAVTLKINSFPFEKWSGAVQQIHPSAEVIGDKTVFVAEVEIDNGSGELRPGMRGTAKISTGWSPLGWNLFHGAWESLRYWTVW
jgi:RND family efflux transporter MFP subunit